MLDKPAMSCIKCKALSFRHHLLNANQNNTRKVIKDTRDAGKLQYKAYGIKPL